MREPAGSMRMSLALASVIALLYLPLWAQVQQSSARLLSYSDHGTLILAVYTQEGFALAADGATLGPDGSIREVQKIFPVGNSGAITFVGYLAVQDNGRSAGEVD